MWQEVRNPVVAASDTTESWSRCTTLKDASHSAASSFGVQHGESMLFCYSSRSRSEIVALRELDIPAEWCQDNRVMWMNSLEVLGLGAGFVIGRIVTLPLKGPPSPKSGCAADAAAYEDEPLLEAGRTIWLCLLEEP